MASPKHNYTILRLPQTSPHLASLVSKFRSTKLSALHADPTGFITQHATEESHPLPVWSARFARSTTLVCIPTPDPTLSAQDALLASEWIGFIALRGPMTYSDYYLAPEAGQHVPDGWAAEARWHMFDLYTLVAHRERGVARRLVQACVDTVVEITAAAAREAGDGSIKRARIRLFCKPNAWLVDMYRRLGFEEAGRVTLKEGFQANGMEESIPGDTGSTEELRGKWETRYGQAMEKVVEIV